MAESIDSITFVFSALICSDLAAKPRPDIVTVARSSASNRYNNVEDSMLIKRPSDIRSSEITDKKLYLDRRQFIRAAGGTAVAAATGIGLFSGAEGLLEAAQPAPHGRKLENIQKSPLSVDEK